jgi:hypothetical protein
MASIVSGPALGAGFASRGAAVHYHLGRGLAFWGWQGGAAHAFRDALRVDPNFAPAHVGLGEALLRRGEWWASSRSFREAARLHPSSAEIQGNLVLTLGRAGLWDAAILALERLSRLRPNEAQLHVLRGALLLARLHRPADAIRAFRFAARLETSPVWSRFFLGEALLGPRLWTDTVQAFLSARRGEGEGWRGLTTLAQSDLNRHPGEAGRTESSAQHRSVSDRARVLAPAPAWARFFSAGSYTALGRFFAFFRLPHRAIPWFREAGRQDRDAAPRVLPPGDALPGRAARWRSSRAPGLRRTPARS